MAASTKKKARTGDQWLEAEEVPRAGLPGTQQMLRRRRVARILVAVIVFGLFPLSCLVSLAAIGSDDGDTAAASAVAAESPGRGVATVAVQEWLAGVPAPLPSAKLIGWTGSMSVPTPAVERGEDEPRFSTEIDTFLVVTNGGQFTVSVQVAVDSRGGASVISAPSAMPVTPVAGDGWDQSANPWPGYRPAPIGPSVPTAVTAWAAAFTGGDPAALRVVVGDPDAQHVYLPLAGVQSVDATVGAAMHPDAEQDRLVVRVNLSLLWDRQTLGADQTMSAMAFDVLVDRATTAAPVIVAWGAPGSAAQLAPHINGVDRPDLASASPTPLAAPADTTTGPHAPENTSAATTPAATGMAATAPPATAPAKAAPATTKAAATTTANKDR